MAAKKSGGVATVTASLPTAQEVRLAVQYRRMGVNGGEMKEEKEISGFTSRFAALSDREERLAAIAGDLRRMKEQRGSRAPTYIELAAFVLMSESAAAALEGLPTTLGRQPLFN